MLKISPISNCRKMYTSIVEPYFRNCCSVWGFCGEFLVDKLQKLQNRAAQIITYSSYDAPSLRLIGSQGSLTIRNNRIWNYNYSLEISPEYVQLMFTKLSEYGLGPFRNTDRDLRIPRFATSYGQRSFSYRCVTAWNKLSTEIKHASSLATFAEAIFENQKV